jgi:hypothetical protein
MRQTRALFSPLPSQNPKNSIQLSAASFQLFLGDAHDEAEG